MGDGAQWEGSSVDGGSTGDNPTQHSGTRPAYADSRQQNDDCQQIEVVNSYDVSYADQNGSCCVCETQQDARHQSQPLNPLVDSATQP